ncbi:MAG: hypothetical protein JWM11_7013 [Planctomycetaceae bacterium]|nr:hypothetical protein [Planctomycetaceae bacterium]
MLRYLLRPCAYIWASPSSLLGICSGVLGLLTGGGWQLRRGVLEFHGGFIHWAFIRFPGVKPAAMTLGHTILGRNIEALNRTRNHEHVHVRQYERWGPFFLPAYLLCSCVLWLRGGDPYLDNPFEVEAFEQFP